MTEGLRYYLCYLQLTGADSDTRQTGTVANAAVLALKRKRSEQNRDARWDKISSLRNAFCASECVTPGLSLTVELDLCGVTDRPSYDGATANVLYINIDMASCLVSIQQNTGLNLGPETDYTEWSGFS